MKVTIRQISVTSDPERTFFLKLEWAKDLGAGFVVLLCDGSYAWSGEVSEEDVTREAQEMEMARERYVDDLQLALTGAGQAAADYSFHLAPERPGSAALQLAYEKVQNDISFRLGVVELQPVPEPTAVIRELISLGLERCSRLQAKNQHLQTESRSLRSEQEHITSEMERYVRGKENLEKELYGRFVLVLNEKKAKIRALQERVKQLQDAADSQQLERGRAARAERAAPGESDAPTESRAAEESDYGASTDEEQEGEPKPPAPQNPVQETASHSLMDDSLSDITDVAPCRKRRQRRLRELEAQAKRVAVEKQAKRTTVETQQRSRKEPIRAKAEASEEAAQRTTQATLNPDPDDLFDDI